MHAVLNTTILIEDIEIPVNVAFDFTYTEWKEYHPYSSGAAAEDMAEIENLNITEVTVLASKDQIAPLSIDARNKLNNTKYLAGLIDEDELEQCAIRNI